MSIAIKLKVRGLAAAEKVIFLAGRRFEEAVAAAVYEEALTAMDESQKLVPVSATGSGGRRPGFLRDSRFVVPPRIGAKRFRPTLGYWASYAIFVHEIISARHRIGQAKFLEKAIMARRSGAAGRLSRLAGRKFRARAGIRSVRARHPTKAR